MIMSECPICKELLKEAKPLEEGVFYTCTNCGQFFLPSSSLLLFSNLVTKKYYDKNKLKSYLYYNKLKNKRFFIGSQEAYTSYLKNTLNSKISLVAPEMVESWHPKTFSEKIDKILLHFSSMMNYIGEQKMFTNKELVDIYFIHYDETRNEHEPTPENCRNQISYINKYFEEVKLVSIYSFNDLSTRNWDHPHRITIQPQGWARIDELQKNKSSNKNVFIAMKFGNETLDLRDTLKLAILEAGYLPVLIDEVQYNGQIVPEMLYQIRESRFVIAELSHHNNGAYYEAGYALGLGKEVIHICEEEAMGSKLHFDVKQVNTITYKADDLDGLKERLIKRIQATIK